MALLGRAAIAMWWEMSPAMQREFEDWHSHEHLPERLAIPGFLRGSRWADAAGGEGYFVLYELDDRETLTSPKYLERLNRPTTWSTRLMPHHRNMVRSQCRVLESFGGGVARHALTLRFAPDSDAADRLRAFLGERARAAASTAGTTAAHLLRTETPDIALTTEQKIRGGLDRAADWIFVVLGHDLGVLDGLRAGELSAAELSRHGALAQVEAGLYTLSHAVAAADRLHTA